jgi:26S proteasome regulatory subunit N1
MHPTVSLATSFYEYEEPTPVPIRSPTCFVADWLTVLLACGTMMISLLFVMLIETEKYGKLRSVFDARPW